MSAIGVHPLERRPGDTMTREWGPGSDADIGRSVARRFERAVAEPSERTMAALREATIALATALRATALGPERAVVMLKEVLRGHGGTGWAPSIAAQRGVVPPRPEWLVYDALFTWWVDAYFAERPRKLPAPDPHAPPVRA